MHLHKIVRRAIGAVNPSIPAVILASTGYTTAANGSRIPTFAPPVEIRVQMQALQYNDIAMTDGLNVQGERRAMYVSGNWEAAVRADGKGGDCIVLEDASVWLVAMVLENWGDQRGFVKLAVTRQVGNS